MSDRFEILAQAGLGGMGVVYRALDRETGARVALKVLHGYGPKDTERFAREAWILSELRHPNIVRFVLQGATSTGDGFLAMEWLEGESLAERLARSRLSVHEAISVAERVARALAVAHQQGIVHRDLKPGNLFLVGGATTAVKVLDFGIARLLPAGHTLTATGVMLGTPGYMPPEQLRGEKSIDARVDLYALGCVLFRSLAGRTPHMGDDPLSVMLKTVTEPAPSLASLRPDVPPALDALCAELLARLPDDRPGSAEAVASALQSMILEQRPLASARASGRAVPSSSVGVAARSSIPAPNAALAPSTTIPPTRVSVSPLALLKAPSKRWFLAFAATAVVAVAALSALVMIMLGQALPGSSRCTADACAELDVADHKRVDPVEWVPFAQKLATSVDPTAELVYIIVHATDDGTAEIGDASSPSYIFAGKRGSIFVAVMNGMLTATRTNGGGWLPIRQPICTARGPFALWRLAASPKCRVWISASYACLPGWSGGSRRQVCLWW